MISDSTGTAAVPAALDGSGPAQVDNQVPAEPELEENQVLAEVESEPEDNEPDDGLDVLPPLLTWSPCLEVLLGDERGTLADVRIVCHLIELFSRHASAELRTMLPPADLIRQLHEKSCSKALIFALCTCYSRFSVHQAFKVDIESQFEKSAREQAQAFDDMPVKISLIQAFCFLIEQAAYRGNGHRAWIDIGGFNYCNFPYGPSC